VSEWRLRDLYLNATSRRVGEINVKAALGLQGRCVCAMDECLSGETCSFQAYTPRSEDFTIISTFLKTANLPFVFLLVATVVLCRSLVIRIAGAMVSRLFLFFPGCLSHCRIRKSREMSPWSSVTDISTNCKGGRAVTYRLLCSWRLAYFDAY